MVRRILWTLVIGYCTAASAEVPLGARHVLVVDPDKGEVLLDKDSSTVVPIASLTKLMTAMVVLDAGQDPDEVIRIEAEDVDTLKHTGSRLSVGAHLSRRSALRLALTCSDNRAAAALARTYPGGREAFMAAVGEKLRELGMESTSFAEPTGLSASNRSSASDLVKLVHAASAYFEITQFTTQSKDSVEVNGREIAYQNTNHLVGTPGWNILLSKTGFTNEAGYCVAMWLQAETKKVIVVLLGAAASSQRMVDTLNVQRWLAGETTYLAAPASHRTHFAKARHPGTRLRRQDVAAERPAQNEIAAPEVK